MTEERSALSLKDRRNIIVSVFGMKGSGKSQLLGDYFIPRHYRVITIDWTREAQERYPRAVVAKGYRALIETIAECHEANPKRWHVVAQITEADAVRLFALCLPDPDNPRPSLSAALGGITIECGEIDFIAPVSATPEPIRNALKRGRHEALNMVLATQRPAECSRLITSQSDIIVSFAMHEARDLKYLRDTCGSQFADLAGRLPRFWSVWRTIEDGGPAISLRDENYQVVNPAQFLLDNGQRVR